jgi:hypothetical protein
MHFCDGPRIQHLGKKSDILRIITQQRYAPLNNGCNLSDATKK